MLTSQPAPQGGAAGSAPECSAFWPAQEHHVEAADARIDVPERAGLRLAKYHVPEIVFGEGALGEAAHAAARLGARRPMLVTDPGLLATPWVGELRDYLAEAGLRPVPFSGLTPNPKDHEITAGYRRYRDQNADVVLGIGGGSVIDAAKGIALLAAAGGDILDFEGVDRSSAPIPPLVMMPSTAGTGADVSQFCIVTDTQQHTKITIVGRTLVPDVSVIDPRLLSTMPDSLAAATGLDALTHGIEAFVSRAHNPLTDHHALNSVALVNRHLLRTIDCPGDGGARVLMAEASLQAGLAFTNAILGAAHAMSHQIGGLLDLPHGVINAVLLPHVVRFNAAAEPERFAAIARALGRTVGESGQAGEAVAEEVRALADAVGVPKGLAELGVTAEHVPVLAAHTMHDACLATNPRAATEPEIGELFRAAL
jgi:1,3-propanediol dehydrogenase